jgi:hypothetical protein
MHTTSHHNSNKKQKKLMYAYAMSLPPLKMLARTIFLATGMREKKKKKRSPYFTQSERTMGSLSGSILHTYTTVQYVPVYRIRMLLVSVKWKPL